MFHLSYLGADPGKREEAARAKWYPGDFSWGESTGEAIQLAFRGRDPLADAEGLAAFVDTSLRIYAALRGGRTDGGEGAA